MFKPQLCVESFAVTHLKEKWRNGKGGLQPVACTEMAVPSADIAFFLRRGGGGGVINAL